MVASVLRGGLINHRAPGLWKAAFHITLAHTLENLSLWQDCKFQGAECLSHPSWNPGFYPRAWHRENTGLIFVKWMNKYSCNRCASREPIAPCLSLLFFMRGGLKLFIGKNAIYALYQHGLLLNVGSLLYYFSINALYHLLYPRMYRYCAEYFTRIISNT